MSKLRSVNTAFWSDPFIEELDSDQKLLFLYLITNEKTNMLGIYEATLNKMSFETSIPKSKIEKAFTVFESKGKVKYVENFVVLINYMKHQKFNTNMKKSAIDTYNTLPNSMKNSKLSISKERVEEGFESLLNHFGMVRKVEVKVEAQDEEEIEEEIFLCSISDETELSNDFQKVAFSFWKLFKENLIDVGLTQTTTLDKARLSVWENDIRLSFEQDGRTKKEFQVIWHFLKKSDFWKKNIQSTSKLRKQFERLFIEAAKERKQNDPHYERKRKLYEKYHGTQ